MQSLKLTKKEEQINSIKVLNEQINDLEEKIKKMTFKYNKLVVLDKIIKDSVRNLNLQL